MIVSEINSVVLWLQISIIDIVIERTRCACWRELKYLSICSYMELSSQPNSKEVIQCKFSWMLFIGENTSRKFCAKQ